MRLTVPPGVLDEVLDERLRDRSLTHTEGDAEPAWACPWASLEQMNKRTGATDSGRRLLGSVCWLEHAWQRKSPQSGQVALAETQQLRMLERLRSAGEQPVTLDELRAVGIDFPAVVLSELEINGYVIERLHEHGRLLGVRLRETDNPDAPASRWRQRWRRRSR